MPFTMSTVSGSSMWCRWLDEFAYIKLEVGKIKNKNFKVKQKHWYKEMGEGSLYVSGDYSQQNK